MKLFLAIFFICISSISAVIAICKIRCFPDNRISDKKNYYKISFYSSFGAFLDFIMTIFITMLVPEGEYGTGIELIVGVIVILAYGIPCVICSNKLRKRMLTKKMRSPSRINALNCSIILKFVFAIIITIFLVEVVKV